MTETLETRHLRAFVILVRTGSFTKAARELHLTQSAVSHSMKVLEQQAGCRLLDRTGKKATATEAGELLLVHAERILAEIAQARAALERLGKWGQTRLRLGASTTATQHILPGVLSALGEKYPKCAVAIEPGDTPEMIEALRAHRIDLAFNLEPRREEWLNFRPIFTDELQFIVSPSHPWAQSGHVVREEIPRQKYILYKRKSYTSEMIESYFREEKVVLFSQLDLGNMAAIKEMVKLGLGVSILALWTARTELQDGSLVALPLGRRKLRRRWGILHWQGRRLSLVEENFIGLCKRVTERPEFQ
jgi:LysR family transcriptional regulator, low CO2-responsive transcriptional regulator